MDEPIALDVHAHLVPIVKDRLGAIPGLRWNAESGLLEVDGHSVAAPALYKPDALLAWMDHNRVERAWISIPPPMYRQHLDEDAARAWTQYVNDGLALICADHPDRLAPLFHLPIEHPASAASIAGDLIGKGARGFAMAAGGRAAPVYSDAVLEPLWTNLDAAKAFVFLHPGACCDDRLKAFYLENLVGNPHETAVAVAHLVARGVAERYPAIEFCLAHGGGNTAMIAGRLEHGFTTGRPGVDTSVESPERALRRFRVDCITHGSAALNLAAETFGADRIVFGSDWPFPMGLQDPHRQLATVSPALKRKLCWDNPRALLADPIRSRPDR